ncbi:MAG: ATP-grasp domain-containing protein [Planctomycetaceae bacterium]|nr:ATP-grasp domain-containing protein [Planctomycetaceae bacterium]
MTEKRPVIMIVAGGQWQVSLIRKAREFGAFVINSNLYPDSPGFEFAHVGRIADVRDLEANLRIANEFRPDAILTDQSDIAVPTVAALCEKLGLPGIGVDTARRFTNKCAMRKVCRESGHPTPSFEECTTESDAIAFFRRVGGPVVVKPLDSQSSRGVRRVDSHDQIPGAFREARRFCSSEHVLVEEFIGGLELTIEGIQTSSGHTSLAISTKRHYDHNPMVADRLLYARDNHDLPLDVLVDQHDSLMMSMGLPFGLTHSEYKYNGGRFYLIETAARGGGTNIASHIVPAVSGVDTYDLLLRMALGQNISAIECSHQAAAVLVFYEFHPGRVEKITGVDKALSIDGVIDLQLNIQVGEVLKQSTDDRSRHMHVIATGISTQEVLDSVRMARECIHVQYA